MRRTYGFISPARAAAYTPLKKGDAVFALSGETVEDIGSSAEICLDGDMVAGGDLAILRPALRFQPGFLGYSCRAPHAAVQKSRGATGTTVKHVSVSHLRRVVVGVPPLDDQAAIVRFLDHATRRIDAYIRAKRRLIALLNEQKQAIIHRAVTRGLDPNVKMKDSGVPWLGEVPEHWGVRPIKSFARVGNGSTPSRARPAYWEGGTYPWLNSSQVNRERVDSADQFVTQAALRECHLPRVPAGSVLVAITGQGKTRGKASVLEIEATINQHIAYITLRREVVSPEYLQRLLTAGYAALRRMSDDSGSTRGAITCEGLRRIRALVPPMEEQEKIVVNVASETRSVSDAIDRTEREITLLREYRTRLIADVVTGQLDVREAAKTLPDELPDDAPDLDDATDADPLDEEAPDSE